MPSAVLQQLDTFGPQQCQVLSYADADAYTRRLATTHYENFTVLSWFLPRDLRGDFAHVYAFCRWADDLGDETADTARSLELLQWWRSEVDLCYQNRPRHPVFVALTTTIEKHDIPRKPFDDLIDAFIQDQTLTRYDTWDRVVDYCTRSADPVGRLVLYLCGYRDPQRQTLSDATCTALQLTNFWQDVRRDILERDRVYIPSEIAQTHGLNIDAMVAAVKQHDAAGTGLRDAEQRIQSMLPAYTATIRDLVDRTRPGFTRGRSLLPMLPRRVRGEVRLFTQGGEAILRRIQAIQYQTLIHRPTLSKHKKITLMLRAAAAKLCP